MINTNTENVKKTKDELIALCNEKIDEFSDETVSHQIYLNNEMVKRDRVRNLIESRLSESEHKSLAIASYIFHSLETDNESLFVNGYELKLNHWKQQLKMVENGCEFVSSDKTDVAHLVELRNTYIERSNQLSLNKNRLDQCRNSDTANEEERQLREKTYAKISSLTDCMRECTYNLTYQILKQNSCDKCHKQKSEIASIDMDAVTKYRLKEQEIRESGIRG